MNYSSAVIIDNGTGMCRAGIAGNDTPNVCFPTVVGYLKKLYMDYEQSNDCYYGNHAIHGSEIMNLEYPMARGKVSNWDSMTKIWNNCYTNELGICPTEQPVHLIEATNNPKSQKEKMMEIFFEELKVPAFYISDQAKLALYSTGKTTGLAINSGEGVTSVVPIYETFTVNIAKKRMEIGGGDLTQWLKYMLLKARVKIDQKNEDKTFKFIKENNCYVASDFEEEIETLNDRLTNKIDYRLPDGENISVQLQNIKCPQALFKCPEVLFKPYLMDMNIKGIHKNVYDFIFKCEIDIRRELFRNIVLSGGSTMFPGIHHRLVKEISALAPSKFQVNVIAPSERKLSAWIGGSALSILNSFNSMWITKEQYEEIGSSIVHRKCF